MDLDKVDYYASLDEECKIHRWPSLRAWRGLPRKRIRSGLLALRPIQSGVGYAVSRKRPSGHRAVPNSPEQIVVSQNTDTPFGG